MEKTEFFEDHTDETILHGSGVSYGFLLREIVELILVVAYFYLRHGREYFDLIFGNIYMIPFYCLYFVVGMKFLLDYLPRCENGDAPPICAIKSGTFRECRCPEEVEEDTAWRLVLNEASVFGAGILMDEILSRGLEYLEAWSADL